MGKKRKFDSDFGFSKEGFDSLEKRLKRANELDRELREKKAYRAAKALGKPLKEKTKATRINEMRENDLEDEINEALKAYGIKIN